MFAGHDFGRKICFPSFSLFPDFFFLDIDLGLKCRSKRVQKIMISGIICRRNSFQNKRVQRINQKLESMCYDHSFVFIDNSSIGVSHLYRDGIDLLESSKVILANNFITAINTDIDMMGF